MSIKFWVELEAIAVVRTLISVEAENEAEAHQKAMASVADGAEAIDWHVKGQDEKHKIVRTARRA